MIKRSSAFVIIGIFISVLMAQNSTAQDNVAGIPIQFAGRIDTVERNILIINQLLIDVSSAQISASLQPDSQIIVRGVLLDSGVIAAQSISVYIPPTPTSTPTQQPNSTQPLTPVSTIPPMVQPTPSTFTIEGPVQAIDDGVIIVNSISFSLDHDDPIFAELSVGDVLRIEGDTVQVSDEIMLYITGVSVISRARGANGVTVEDEDAAMEMGMGH